jgi:hypothetical protein
LLRVATAAASAAVVAASVGFAVPFSSFTSPKSKSLSTAAL